VVELGETLASGSASIEAFEARSAEGRARLLAELTELGYSPAELDQAIAQDRLAVLLLQQVFRNLASFTASDVARESGAAEAEVLRMWRLLRRRSVAPDEQVFDSHACEAMRVVQSARNYGVSQQAIDELLSVLGHRMWQLAADLLIILGNEFARPGDTEYELAHRYADAAAVFATATEPMVSSAFNAHFRDRLQEIFVSPAEAYDGSLRATTDVTVAFVDVVGFTALGQRVEARELKTVAARLVDLATDVIEAPVWLINTVGDAILLMSRDSTALAGALAAILERAAATTTLPPVHAGAACGDAHVGGGDVYGAPVNLASRLTDLAPARRLWTTADLAARTASACSWRPLGPRSIRGSSESVEVFELDRGTN
jgi:adenylate cyclase